MTFEDVLRGLGEYRSRNKIKIDKVLDPLSLYTITNLSLIGGVDKTLEIIGNSDIENKGLISAGVYMLGAGGFYFVNRLCYGLTRRIVEFKNQLLSGNVQVGIGSWVKTLGELGAIGLLGFSLYTNQTFNHFSEDFQKITSSFTRTPVQKKTQTSKSQREETTEDSSYFDYFSLLNSKEKSNLEEILNNNFSSYKIPENIKKKT